MVLYYGLLALETANKTITARTVASQRASLPREKRPLQNSIEKLTPSSNSWIYTEDLRKRFEERYGDHRHICIPVYVNGKNSDHNHSTITIIPSNCTGDNSWMYSRSFRNHIFYSTSRIFSSAYCVPHQITVGDHLPTKKMSKRRYFNRSSSSKTKSTISSPSTSFNLTIDRTNDVAEEDNEHENRLTSLIQHQSTTSPQTSNDKNILVHTTLDNNMTNTKLDVKLLTKQHNRLTRLRAFFSKSSSFQSDT